MATHSSTLAWRIPWMEEPGGLQSMGSLGGRTWLSDFTFTSHFHALEKEMATHSSVPAWRIPGTEEPGGLPSMGLHRVGHDWSNLAAAAAKYDWEKTMATHSSTLAWRIPWLEEPGRLWSMGSRRVWHTQSQTRLKWLNSSSSSKVWLGEGNSNPLQYPCLENSMDGGAWQATVHGVTKRQTRLSGFTFFLSITVLAWRIPWTEGPGGLQSMGAKSQTWLSN